jgi:DNA-3-methyladenine glycosylase II
LNFRHRPSSVVRTHLIPVIEPFRLDLTVSVLRRLPTNIVDLLTPEGDYLRALSGAPQPLIVRVNQIPDNRSLSITIDGYCPDEPQMLRLEQKVLGGEKDISDFDKRSAHIPWLAPLVRRMRGVKPPCYPTLWEACVNAIVFQQLSIRAASAIMRRLIMALGQRVERDSLPLPLYVFPAAERFQEASDDTLRATGLSASKVGTLRRVAERLMSGTLEAKELEEVSSGDAMTALCRIKGIGPWTAAIILLRGMGRLDVFPANDSSVVSNMTLMAGPALPDARLVLDDLGPQRGMLYFYLLLARLEASGEILRESSWNA